VTGKLFIWLDEEGAITTGTQPTRNFPAPEITLSSSVGKTVNGTSVSLDYALSVKRSLSVTSTVTTSKGSRIVRWQSQLGFENKGSYTDEGNTQMNYQTTTGVDISSSGYSRAFSYPLDCNSTVIYYPPSSNFSILGTIDRGKDVVIVGQPVFPSGLQPADLIHAQAKIKTDVFTGSKLTTRQNGTATYTSLPAESRSVGSGTTEQELAFGGVEGAIHMDATATGIPTIEGYSELYHRHVLARNSSIVFDDETLLGVPLAHSHIVPPAGSRREFSEGSVRRIIGHGPP
jgi:hypothetical protein